MGYCHTFILYPQGKRWIQLQTCTAYRFCVLSMPQYVVLHPFVYLHPFFTNWHAAFDLVQYFKQADEKLLNFYNSWPDLKVAKGVRSWVLNPGSRTFPDPIPLSLTQFASCQLNYPGTIKRPKMAKKKKKKYWNIYMDESLTIRSITCI